MNNVKAIITGAVIFAIVIVAIVAFVTLSGDDEESAADSAPSFAAVSSVVADAVVLPLQSAELSMSAGGIVTNILVEEGVVVTEGQSLMRLDSDSQVQGVSQAKANLSKAEARLEKLIATHAKTASDDDEARAIDIAEAKIDIRDSREDLAHVSGQNARSGSSISADGALREAARLTEIANASRALRDAQDGQLLALGVESTDSISASPTSISNAAARQANLADARLALLNAEESLEDTEDVEESFAEAQEDVVSATNAFNNAVRDVDVARISQIEDTKAAQILVDETEDDYRELYQEFLGVDLTEEEVLNDSVTNFENWGIDLVTLFNRSTFTGYNGGLGNNPESRIDESKVYAWLYLYPDVRFIDVTCETRVDLSQRDCLQEDFRSTFESFDNSLLSFSNLINDSETAIVDAENAVISAGRVLEDAQDRFDEFSTDRPDFDVAITDAALADAFAVLRQLEDFPNPVDVATSEAEVATAQAMLDDLMDWPDPLQVALVEEQLAMAELELQKLENGRDPLIVAREKAEISEAKADVDALSASLELAEIKLADMELTAPFGGTVISIEIDPGEEVSPSTIVVRLADVSGWIIETDDLDELSVVNLLEGDTVAISFDAIPDLEINGSVVNINEFGETKQGAITYTAEIKLDSQDPRLRWNMTAAIKKDIGTNTSFTPVQ